MSAEIWSVDSPFTPRQFSTELEICLISICEQYVTLESEPRYRIVDTLMREFHSLSGTAANLGCVELSRTAAVAGEACLLMIGRGQYNRISDLLTLERLISEMDRHLTNRS